MSELVLQDSNVIASTNKTVDPKIVLRNKNDLKFLIDVAIMAMFNVMLIVWQPFIEIPVTIGLIICSIIMHINIKNYKIVNDLQ